MLAVFAIIFLLFCWRRNLRKQKALTDRGGVTEKYGEGIRTQLVAGNLDTQGLRSSRRAQPDNSSWPAIPLLAPQAQSQGERHSETNLYRSLERTPSVSSLPNPYDAYVPERDLPPVPMAEPSPMSREPIAELHPPSGIGSAYSYDEVLARGRTQASTTSRVSTASDLLSEMANYQKRLEAHHEKELSARDEEGEEEQMLGTSSAPADPPPSYQEDVALSSTTGEVGHNALQ